MLALGSVARLAIDASRRCAILGIAEGGAACTRSGWTLERSAGNLKSGADSRSASEGEWEADSGLLRPPIRLLRKSEDNWRSLWPTLRAASVRWSVWLLQRQALFLTGQGHSRRPFVA